MDRCLAHAVEHFCPLGVMNVGRNSRVLREPTLDVSMRTRAQKRLIAVLVVGRG